MKHTIYYNCIDSAQLSHTDRACISSQKSYLVKFGFPFQAPKSGKTFALSCSGTKIAIYFFNWALLPAADEFSVRS